MQRGRTARKIYAYSESRLLLREPYRESRHREPCPIEEQRVIHPVVIILVRLLGLITQIGSKVGGVYLR